MNELTYTTNADPGDETPGLRQVTATVSERLATAMAPTRVVDVRHEPYDIYIGRSGRFGRWGFFPRSPFANPYKGAAAVDLYHAWILGQPDLLARLSELRGQVLGCWCAPADGFASDVWVCHGQVLAYLADRLGDGGAE